MQQVSASDFLQVNINTVKFNQWISQVIKHLNSNQQKIQANQKSISNLNISFSGNKDQISVQIQNLKKRMSIFIEKQNAFQYQFTKALQQKMSYLDSQKESRQMIKDQLKQITIKMADLNQRFFTFKEECVSHKNQLLKLVEDNRNNISLIQDQIFQSECQDKEKGKTQTEVQDNLIGNSIRQDGTCLLNESAAKKETKRISKISRLLQKQSLNCSATARNSTKINSRRLLKTAHFPFDQRQFGELETPENYQTFNKVVYTSEKIRGKDQIVQEQIKENKRQKLSPKMNKKSIINTQMNAQVNKKIKQMQDALAQLGMKQSQLSQYYRNKTVILEQRTQQLTKRMDRESYKSNQFKAQLKKFQETRVDEKVISEFRSLVEKNKIQYEMMICRKVQKETYQNELCRIFQKIGLNQTELSSKADKQEVKKAIVFIQTKIKEVIFVLTQTRQQEKLGAIGKIPMKCLTCDKQIERMSNQSRIKTARMKVQIPIRCQSGHIRRKIKCNTFSKSFQTGFVE